MDHRQMSYILDPLLIEEPIVVAIILSIILSCCSSCTIGSVCTGTELPHSPTCFGQPSAPKVVFCVALGWNLLAEYGCCRYSVVVPTCYPDLGVLGLPAPAVLRTLVVVPPMLAVVEEHYFLWLSVVDGKAIWWERSVYATEDLDWHALPNVPKVCLVYSHLVQMHYVFSGCLPALVVLRLNWSLPTSDPSVSPNYGIIKYTKYMHIYIYVSSAVETAGS